VGAALSSLKAEALPQYLCEGEGFSSTVDIVILDTLGKKERETHTHTHNQQHSKDKLFIDHGGRLHSFLPAQVTD